MHSRRWRTRGVESGRRPVAPIPRRVVALLTLLLLVVAAPRADAQDLSSLLTDWRPIELTDGDVRDLIAQLDAPGFEDREDATDQLMVGGYDDELLYAALNRTISVEQRHRLLLIASARRLVRPRGAVGISIDRRFEPDVVVRSLVENLPAMGKLKVGDRITHIDGREIRSFQTFRSIVQSKAPGERIMIRVERPRAAGDNALPNPLEPRATDTLNIELELGSARMLDQGPGRRNLRDPDDFARRVEVRQLVELHSRPRRLQIQRSPDLVRSRVLDGLPPDLRDRVERHAAIVAVQAEARDLRPEDLPLVVDRWRTWLDMLDRLRRDPGATTEDRLYHDAVHRRMTELVNEALDRFVPGDSR